ncbi:basic phospholipase A2 caudoxin-like [Varroa jacobsoni]|uniref:basic phospholipase A2 caudoxin-like n=1 Tax=Varroa jacobsoni TaxID=62625 RepID=UPI000BF7C351|nr:basic phospholipase A2 caudoxin-like [Varroa jacobsoni]
MWPHFYQASMHLCAILVLIIGTLPNGRASVKLKQSTADYRKTLKKESHLGKEQQLSQQSSQIDGTHVYGSGKRDNGSSIIIVDTSSRLRVSRRRRSVLQLASMLKCVTGCSPLSFHGYGCFCGYLGDGAPVDPIDMCCLEHDWCYSATHCSHLSTYLLPYYWHCTGSGFAYCTLSDSFGPYTGCGQQLCECDLQFAHCISRYPCPIDRARCRYRERSVTRSEGG